VVEAGVSPPGCNEGNDFHVELIGLYIDLIEDGELDSDEETDGWKAIGRMVAYLARYKSDLRERYRPDSSLKRGVKFGRRLTLIFLPS